MSIAAQKDRNDDGIIWICSYPKSGNTWLRLLLANYFYAPEDQPFTINTVPRVIRGDTSLKLYRDICVEKNWDIEDAVHDLKKREYVLCQYIQNHRGSVFLKSHSCFYSVEKQPYFSPSYTKGIISVVRDPRDVLCSYTRHRGKSIDDTFQTMTNEKNALVAETTKHEYVSSWDKHVMSFLGLKIPTMVIRYEDLLKNPHQILGNITHTLKGTVDSKKLDFAVRNSSFDVLQKQEKRDGFIEASENNDDLFFHSGQAGVWKDTLSSAQAKAVEDKFGPAMEKFGYL